MDSANLYGYVAGNPIGWMDPFGLDQVHGGEFVGDDPVQFVPIAGAAGLRKGYISWGEDPMPSGTHERVRMETPGYVDVITNNPGEFVSTTCSAVGQGLRDGAIMDVNALTLHQTSLNYEVEHFILPANGRTYRVANVIAHVGAGAAYIGGAGAVVVLGGPALEGAVLSAAGVGGGAGGAGSLTGGAAMAGVATGTAQVVGAGTLVGGVGLGAVALGQGTAAARALPTQDHHFATDKNRRYSPHLQEIADQYGLDLDEPWNREYLPQLGRHPNAYHDWVTEQMERAAREAGTSRAKFLELYERYVKDPVRQKPEMLRKEYWEALQ